MGLEGLAGKLKFGGEVRSKPGGLSREGGAMAQVCALRLLLSFFMLAGSAKLLAALGHWPLCRNRW